MSGYFRAVTGGRVYSPDHLTMELIMFIEDLDDVTDEVGGELDFS